MVAKNEHHERTSCPVACALDIIGDHWSLLVIRNLMFLERHEYKDMIVCEEHISTNILSNRLKKLKACNIIDSFPHPQNKRRKLYYLTQKGKDTIDIMLSIARWADSHLGELVDMPPEIRHLLYNDPETLKQMTLAKIEAWEKENLPK